VMEESDHKSTVSEGLIRNAEAFAEYLRGLNGTTLHLDHHAPTPGVPASEITAEQLKEMAHEVVRLKGNEFMAARPFERRDPQVEGRALLQTAEQLFRQLEPLYHCSLEPDYRFGDHR